MKQSPVLLAFAVGWVKGWIDNPIPLPLDSPDPFQALVLARTQGRAREAQNRAIAALFGKVVTEVRTFQNGDTWVVLDKYTKKCLAKNVPNEREVEYLCRQNGWTRA